MKLMIGGAYQGKREFVISAFDLTEADIFTCTGTNVDFSARCIDKIENFTLACVKARVDPVAVFRDNREKWVGSILICQDIFCGVVPLGADMRAWRNTTGQLCQYLSGRADSVRRIFCGLEQKLK